MFGWFRCTLLLLLTFAPAVKADGAPIEHTAFAFCLVTHYTENGFHYGAVAGQNHAAYAERHGYGQKTFVGRLSGDDFVDSTQGDLNDLWGGGLFWQKLVAIRRVFEAGVADLQGAARACDWVMWLDSDAIVTKSEIKLEHVLKPFVEQTEYQRPGHIDRTMPVDIVLSGEMDHPINSGVFFVRNTPIGRSFIDALLALYPMYKDNNLPDQTAIATLAFLAEPWPSSSAVCGLQPTLHPSVRLAPQRSFNSFYGLDHPWPPTVQWQQGDFIAHLAGTNWAQREQAMHDLLSRTEAPY